MNLLLEALTLIVGVATGTAVAWLVLNAVLMLAFRRPIEP